MSCMKVLRWEWRGIAALDALEEECTAIDPDRRPRVRRRLLQVTPLHRPRKEHLVSDYSLWPRSNSGAGGARFRNSKHWGGGAALSSRAAGCCASTAD